jgi:hypothetical protein
VTIVLAATAASGALPAAVGTTYTLPEGTGYTLFVPANFQPSAQIDLMVHFHGSGSVYAANDQYAKLNALSVTINLGALSSSYQMPFASDTSLFQKVLDDALAKARSLPAIPDNATWRKVGVTSFSAGYGAVREILKQPAYYGRIDAMVLADTVYASFTSSADHTPLDSQMVDFRRYAQDAVAGTKTLVMSHSQVLTYSYCNTIETADDVMAFAGVAPAAVNLSGLGGLHFYRAAAKGNFMVYGATGATGDDHLLHENYIAQWETDLPLAYLPEPAGIMLLAAPAAAWAGSRRRARGPARA